MGEQTEAVPTAQDRVQSSSAGVGAQREPAAEGGGAPPVIDAAFARWLADRAGALLLSVRDEMGYADGKALKAAGDKAAHDLLRSELARWRPADAQPARRLVNAA